MEIDLACLDPTIKCQLQPTVFNCYLLNDLNYFMEIDLNFTI